MLRAILKLLGLTRQAPPSQPERADPPRTDIPAPRQGRTTIPPVTRPVVSAPAEAMTRMAPASPPPPKAALRLSRIEVSLPADRDRPGELVGFATNGAVLIPSSRVVGRSDPAFAKRMGNPDRNPLRPFGGVAYGEYHLVRVLAPQGQDAEKMFGPHGTLLLMPIAGDAALAEARGRNSLLLHGGQPAAAAPGALQTDDDTIRRIVALLPDAALLDREPVRVLIDELVVEEDEADSRVGYSDTAADLGYPYSYGHDPYGHNVLLNQLLLWQIIDGNEMEQGLSIEPEPGMGAEPDPGEAIFDGGDPAFKGPDEDPPSGDDRMKSGGADAPRHEPDAYRSEDQNQGADRDTDRSASDPVASWSPSGGAYDR